MKQKIIDVIDITEEELNDIKRELKEEEIYHLYEDEKVACSLYKYKKKVYEFVYTFGNKPFTECFKEMVKIRYSNNT